MRNLIVFAGFACAGAAAAFPLEALADQWRVHHGIACMSNNYSEAKLTYYGLGVAGQVGNESTSLDAFFNCPIENDSLLNVTGASYRELTVRGYANSSMLGAHEFFACRTYAGGGGGACGTYAKSNAAGVYSLNVSTSAWANGNASDALYIAAKMARKEGGSVNTFWQYKVLTW